MLFWIDRAVAIALVCAAVVLYAIIKDRGIRLRAGTDGIDVEADRPELLPQTDEEDRDDQAA